MEKYFDEYKSRAHKDDKGIVGIFSNIDLIYQSQQ